MYPEGGGVCVDPPTATRRQLSPTGRGARGEAANSAEPSLQSCCEPLRRRAALRPAPSPPRGRSRHRSAPPSRHRHGTVTAPSRPHRSSESRRGVTAGVTRSDAPPPPSGPAADGQFCGRHRQRRRQAEGRSAGPPAQPPAITRRSNPDRDRPDLTGRGQTPTAPGHWWIQGGRAGGAYSQEIPSNFRKLIGFRFLVFERRIMVRTFLNTSTSLYIS